MIASAFAPLFLKEHTMTLRIGSKAPDFKANADCAAAKVVTSDD